MTSAQFDWLSKELSAELTVLREESLLRPRRTVTSLRDGWCEIDGRRLRDFASNDYLNLAHDPRLSQAAIAACEEAGVGARASALISGRSPWHARLERRLAEFEASEACLLFPTGYAANLGTLSALLQPGDWVFSDRLNHASLIDGCRLSGARLRVYRHDNLRRLERSLARLPHDGARRFLVTDAVFSMDGDVAPLQDLCTLAETHDAAVIVDEAHGTGVLGNRGRGVCELLRVEHRVAVRVGTLSKALGCLGGFVAGSQTLIDWLWNQARSQFFSTALPPAVCAAACTAIDIVDSEPERRHHLQQLSRELRSRLVECGFDTQLQDWSPIVPVRLGDPSRTRAIAAALEQAGFLIGCIRPPTVPRGTSRLRISLSAAHRTADLEALTSAIVTAYRDAGDRGIDCDGTSPGRTR